MITGFREKLAVPLRAERDPGAAIHARLIHRIRGQHLGCRHSLGVKPEKRIERRDCSDAWLRKLLGAPVKAPTADQIYIEAAARSKVNNRIESGRKHAHISTGKAGPI